MTVFATKKKMWECDWPPLFFALGLSFRRIFKRESATLPNEEKKVPNKHRPGENWSFAKKSLTQLKTKKQKKQKN